MRIEKGKKKETFIQTKRENSIIFALLCFALLVQLFYKYLAKSKRRPNQFNNRR